MTDGGAVPRHHNVRNLLVQVRIVKSDGAIGLFRGAGPTVVRAMALNMGMLASNDEVCSYDLAFWLHVIMSMSINYCNGLGRHIVCSLGGSIVLA